MHGPQIRVLEKLAGFRTTSEVMAYSQRQERDLRSVLLRAHPPTLNLSRQVRGDDGAGDSHPADSLKWVGLETDLDVPLREDRLDGATVKETHNDDTGSAGDSTVEAENMVGGEVSVLSYNMNVLLMGATSVTSCLIQCLPPVHASFLSTMCSY